MDEHIESICRRCFHSYVCEQFNEHRDDSNQECHFFNDHFVSAADVAPVVRCKDCRWYRNEMCYSHAEEKPNGIEGERCVEPDDYCSYGERKDGEG